MEAFDDYLEYKMFEDSLKKKKLEALIEETNRPDSKYPPIRMAKKKTELGCGGWLILICIAIVVIVALIIESCN